MSKSFSDELLQEFTLGFAFDETIREQLNYEQMIAVADTFLGWALDKSNGPKRCAWLAGYPDNASCSFVALSNDLISASRFNA